MNRVALLKSENEKASKRIEETKKRAGDIMSLRVQNEKKALAKEKFYRDKWESVKQAQSANAYARDKAKHQMEAVKRAMAASKAAQVQAVKQVAQDHLLQKKEREANEAETNRHRATMIKRQKEEGQKIREVAKQEKL